MNQFLFLSRSQLDYPFKMGELDIEDARWDIMGGVIGISGNSNSKIKCTNLSNTS